MTPPRPVLCVFDGEVFRPSNRHHAAMASEQFGAGEVIPLVQLEDRSPKSHRHYFAAINESWQNLPESLASTYPSAEHLRKAALVRTGYCNERSIVCDHQQQASEVAALAAALDEYAIIATGDNVVKVWTAKSQSAAAMGRRDFQQSKSDVLDWIASLIGVTSTMLPTQEPA